jgi:hypothetical protein
MAIPFRILTGMVFVIFKFCAFALFIVTGNNFPSTYRLFGRGYYLRLSWKY